MKLALTLTLLLIGLPTLLGIKGTVAVLLLGSITGLCLWINAKARGKYKGTSKQDAFEYLRADDEYTTPGTVFDDALAPESPFRSHEDNFKNE